MALRFHDKQITGLMNQFTIKLTQAEYDALPEQEKMDPDKYYLITDSPITEMPDNLVWVDTDGKIDEDDLPSADKFMMDDNSMSIEDKLDSLDIGLRCTELRVKSFTNNTYNVNEDFNKNDVTLEAVFSIGEEVITVKQLNSNQFFVVSPSSFVESQAGQVNVVLGYTDPIGITKTCNFEVTVVDGWFWKDGEEATSEWWYGLKEWLRDPSRTTDDLAAQLGKTVSITIPFNVVGDGGGYDLTTSNTHLLRCIGYNCDHSIQDTSAYSLTFQTADCVGAGYAYFNNSSMGSEYNNDMIWHDSYIRFLCLEYRYAFCKTYGQLIMDTCSKGTCEAINSSQTGTPTYHNETVFLPSDCEMGFVAGKTYNLGQGYAASYDEFDQYNTSKIPYQYYTTNASRKKYLYNRAQQYWERSLHHSNINYACQIDSGGSPDSCPYNMSGRFAPAFVVAGTILQASEGEQ